jgi:hypothetical protein
MKKHLLLLIALTCILATPSLSAQSTPEYLSLIGVWQMCVPSSDDVITIDSQTGELSLDTAKLKVTPIYKTLGIGGDFTNLFLIPDAPRIWAYGTYSIESTDVYVEHVIQHYDSPIYNNKDTRLSYHFWKNNYCILTYEPPGSGQKALEIYRRVTGDVPQLSPVTKPAPSTLDETKQSFFFAKTVDNFHWKGTDYMCNISPLSSISGYDTVYNDKEQCRINYGMPMIQDKNYQALWTIINDVLYLYDVVFMCARDSSSLKLDYDNIEKFLNAKFLKKSLSKADKKNELYKNGVIPAKWFTGKLYIKRFPKREEYAFGNDYRSEEFLCFVFEKGRLIEEKGVTSMDSP